MALSFGSPEYFALVVLGMTGAAVLGRGSAVHSLTSVVIGMVVGLVGIDITSGAARFTFGSTNLLDGLNIGVVAMGLFGIAEIVANARTPPPKPATARISFRQMLPSREEFSLAWRAIARGTVIGSGIGLLPGAGPVLASIMGYAVERQVAREPARFGQGAIEGVVAPEAAANAACQVGFVPTLTLGIPADPIMAIMLAALTVKGISPGPQFISQHPEIFWSLIVSFVIGNVILVIWHVPFIGVWVRLLAVPFHLLYPIVLTFMCIGIYSVRQSPFDILAMLVFGGDRLCDAPAQVPAGAVADRPGARSGDGGASAPVADRVPRRLHELPAAAGRRHHTAGILLRAGLEHLQQHQGMAPREGFGGGFAGRL